MRHNVSLSDRHKWSTLSLYKVDAAKVLPCLEFSPHQCRDHPRDDDISLDPKMRPAALVSSPSCDLNHFNMSNQRPRCDGTEEQQ